MLDRKFRPVDFSTLLECNKYEVILYLYLG